MSEQYYNMHDGLERFIWHNCEYCERYAETLKSYENGDFEASRECPYERALTLSVMSETTDLITAEVQTAIGMSETWELPNECLAYVDLGHPIPAVNPPNPNQLQLFP